MKRNAIDEAAESYFANTGEDENGQGELFDNDELEQVANVICGSEMADKFEMKLVLILKPVRDNALPLAIPIARGKCAAQYVEELVDISVNGSYFRNVLRSAVGQPSGVLKQKLDEAKQEKGIQ